MQNSLTTPIDHLCNAIHMAGAIQLHPEEPLGRRHYIAEWAAKADMSQADISRALEVDKSVVSRWFKGNRPRDEQLANLATILGAPETLSLFRHPDDDWMARFLRGRSEEEKARMRQTLEAAFPRKSA